MTANLQGLAALRRSSKARGITSICSAHPLVLRAAEDSMAGDSLDG